MDRSLSPCCATPFNITASIGGKSTSSTLVRPRRWLGHSSPSRAEEIAAKETSFFPGIDQAVLATAIAQYKSIGVWNGGIEIPRDLYEQSLNVFESTGAIKTRHPYDEVCFPVAV
jgi:hypothetical protein